MDREKGEDLGSVILKIVDTQLMTNNPPAARRTYDRLMLMGFSEESTKNLIAGVLYSWIQEMLDMDRDPFDIAKYEQTLDSLP